MVDVAVVGSGIVGLTCAVRLQQRGLRVAVIAADPPDRTVSAIAAAVWYPTRTDGTPRVLDQARRTFEVFAEQAREPVPGVVMRPTRMLLRAPVDERPWWAAAVPDLRYCPLTPVADAGMAAEWRCTVPTVEMRPYLAWLLDRFRAAGGVLHQRRLVALSDAAEVATTVVNATGLAAGRLADDPAVYPVRGQVVVVANPGIGTSVRDEGHPAGPAYVHPRRRDVVLGGTFEPLAADHPTPDVDGERPDPAVSRAIRARCAELVPELTAAPVLGHYVGLRPARHGGARVEVDSDPPPGITRLVHCYGHGGAGMTLSWGCADEVATLVAG